MLLDITKPYMKYLDFTGEDKATFVDDGASEEDRDNLISLDEDWEFIYGKHLITNYKDL